jgi:hypothetical protein
MEHDVTSLTIPLAPTPEAQQAVDAHWKAWTSPRTFNIRQRSRWRASPR